MTSRSSGSRAPRRREGETDLDRAKALVLRVLAFHARSEAQLRARLGRAGLDAVAGEALAWARRLGYLDDAAFARARARALVRAGAGPRLAERRLAQAGIPEPEARRAVAEALGDAAQPAGGGSTRGSEAALCRAALERKLRGADPAALDAKGRARLCRFLLGRGFSAEAVSGVLRFDGD